MKNLFTRVASALTALIVLSLISFYGESLGLKILCVVAMMISSYEFIKIVFTKIQSKFFKSLFLATNFLIFFILCQYSIFALSFLPFLAIFYLIICILSEKSFASIEDLFYFTSNSLLGFIYLGVLPAIAIHILDFNKGVIWFWWVLTVVLIGDTAAYFAGSKLGKTKLSPRISPKKTMEGSLGGIVGSILGSLIFYFLMKDISIVFFLIAPLFVAIAGQCGDLFESLLKRVAQVKDSGAIMPGHGGVLDRLDGVFFALPVAYLAIILSAYFQAYTY